MELNGFSILNNKCKHFLPLHFDSLQPSSGTVLTQSFYNCPLYLKADNFIVRDEPCKQGFKKSNSSFLKTSSVFDGCISIMNDRYHSKS